MAKQTFTTGQVLTAAQVTALQGNDYNQTVTTQTTNYVLLAADVGTRVYMNAAGATTITVNTGVFAAGDTVWLGNIGAGSCVVTAGTATVSKFSTASLTLSQYQGAYLYFVSTGVAILYSDSAGASTPLTTKGDLFGYSTLNARVPIGTDAQVLTADSAQALGLKWAAAPAAAQNFSLIGTGTTTSGSTVTVSGISGINSIFIILKSVSTNTANDSLYVRVNGDSSSIYSQNIATISSAATYSANFLGVYDNPLDTRWQIGGFSTNAVSVAVGGVQISGCNSAGVKMMTAVVGTTAGGGNGQSSYPQFGFYTGTSTISSVSLLLSAGTFDSGSFVVYGSA